MIDLRKYYLENVIETEYYYRFYEMINETEIDNVLGINKTDFEIFDEYEAIEKFRWLCQPENDNHDYNDQCWFYLILFYLYKHGYVIEEFPSVINRPPEKSFDFSYKMIRNKMLSEHLDCGGTVRFADRRVFVSNMHITKQATHLPIAPELENKFIQISTRGVSFDSMEPDEQLAEIANLIEYLLKKDNGKFVELDYSEMCFNYISDAKIREYRNLVQCFRHAATHALEERKKYTVNQKKFLLDYGILLLNAISLKLNEINKTI